MANNYYETLGVSKDATQDEIKSAYRKLVKQYHPDLHPGDEACAAKFKEVNEANETLSDPEKRQKYDYQLEHPGMSGGFDFGEGFSGFGDIFNNIFGGGFGGGARQEVNRKGQDITLEVELSFLDAAKGCKKDISYMRKEPCAKCRGTGAKNGTEYTTCSKCKGRGQVQYTSGGGFFQTISTRTCPDCGGTGKNIKEKCPDCQGKGYNRARTVFSQDIPAGADTNSYIRKRGFGDASMMGGEAGDLIAVFKVAPHKIFTRKNFDLYVELPITYYQAVLGGSVKVPTLDNVVEFNIPEGTQSGKTFILRGKGIRGRQGTGDLYLTVNVEIPSKISRSEKEKLKAYDEEIELKQYDKIKKFNDNVNSLYGVNYTDRK